MSPLKNSYAILKFDFSSIQTDTHDNSVYGFNTVVINRIDRFLSDYFPEPDKHKNLPPLEARAENILDYALTYVSKYAKSQKVYVLIDEYDHFANEILSFRYNDYLESVAQNGFVRKFYEKLKTFAGNSVIDRIFITGGSPVTVDSLTSGFNISTHITLDEDFHAMVGFTEAEAGKLLARSFPAEQIDAVMNDCKKWYDGYRFSEDTKERIFNPDMLLYFLRYVEKRNSYPKDMLDKNVASDYTKIQKLFSIGNENANLEELDTLIREKQLKSTLVSEFSLQKRFEREDFISILFYSGILTIDQSYNELIQFKMPNLVLEKLYLEFFIRSIANRADIALNIGSLKVTLHELSQNGNLQNFLTLVEELLQKLSNRDFMNFDEKYVKAIICSYLSLSNLYMVKSEYELPESYADLVFFQREPYKVKYQFLFKLKYCKKDSPKKIINELAQEGRKQLQKYCESEEIAEKMANKDCPLKPYLIIFSGCKPLPASAGGFFAGPLPCLHRFSTLRKTIYLNKTHQSGLHV